MIFKLLNSVKIVNVVWIRLINDLITRKNWRRKNITCEKRKSDCKRVKIETSFYLHFLQFIWITGGLIECFKPN